jgi:GPH family glycoside/pentoside/hexuronide:cation symporter
MRREQEEADRQADEERKKELKARCEKKGLNFQEEEAKYQKKQAQKRAKK